MADERSNRNFLVHEIERLEEMLKIQQAKIVTQAEEISQLDILVTTLKEAGIGTIVKPK